MRIGILQAGHPSSDAIDALGDYDEMFRKLLSGYGFTFDGYDVENGSFPDSPADADGWLITGSRHGVYDAQAFIEPLAEFVRASRTVGVPMVGICFGHQLIAYALGGIVRKWRDGWVVGQELYSIGEHDVTLNAWHQDQILEIPRGAVQLGTSDRCEIASLLYDENWCLTFQPHPEFTDDIFEAYLEMNLGASDTPDRVLQSAIQSIRSNSDTSLISSSIAKFFQSKAIAFRG